jgi:DNA-binding MarR family transcriptional regulator
MEEAMTSAGPLADSLAFRLTVLGSVLQKKFAQHLKEAGLSPKHLGVLSVVDRALARTQDDVATLMQVTPGMVVRLVDHLEAHDLLRRQRDPANRRRHILTVTASGTRLLAAAAAFAATLDAQLAATLGPSLAAHLDEALAALMSVLTDPRHG